MTTAAPAPVRVRVVLDAPKDDFPTLLTRARSIYAAMSAAPTDFPTPSPALSVLSAQIQDLDTAQQATHGRVPGSKEVRDAKAGLVLTTLESLQTYVQGLCDASPGQAPTLIVAAAMKARRAPARTKPALAATQGSSSGVVVLRANRGVLVGNRRGALFNWQSSVDGGKTWVAAPATTVAHTEIQGLPPLTTVSFRVSAVTSKVTGPWSQVVALIVH